MLNIIIIHLLSILRDISILYECYKIFIVDELMIAIIHTCYLSQMYKMLIWPTTTTLLPKNGNIYYLFITQTRRRNTIT